MLRPPSPPYSVPPATFRFPALAALAGRLPLGAGREAVIAALLAARIAADTVPPALDSTVRIRRAAAARQWFPALCTDPKLRAACTAVADASSGEAEGAQSNGETPPGGPAVGRALARVMDVTARHLDADARSELASLVKSLGGD